MTAVRVWNGTAWQERPKFATAIYDSGFGPRTATWEQYTIAGTWNVTYELLFQNAVVYNQSNVYQWGWNFYDGMQGWYASYSTPPWETEHFILVPGGLYPPDSDYVYSPDTHGAESYWGDFDCHLRSWNGVGPKVKINVNLYMDKWNNPTRVNHEMNVGESFHGQCVPAMPQNYLGAGYQVLAYADNQTTYRTIDVHYWDGSQWVAQNAY